SRRAQIDGGKTPGVFLRGRLKAAALADSIFLLDEAEEDRIVGESRKTLHVGLDARRALDGRLAEARLLTPLTPFSPGHLHGQEDEFLESGPVLDVLRRRQEVLDARNAALGKGRLEASQGRGVDAKASGWIHHLCTFPPGQRA